MRYWDSSAIVPLLVQQRASAEVDAWIHADPEVAAWTLAETEVHSALWRLVREGEIEERQAKDGESLARDLFTAFHLVTAVEQAKAAARRLLRTHVLRAADALQLAAALLWAEGEPAGRVLHTFDRRLALAAEREGFEVIPAAQ